MRPEYVFTNDKELKVGTPEQRRFRIWLKYEKNFSGLRLTSIKPEVLNQWLNEFRLTHLVK